MEKMDVTILLSPTIYLNHTNTTEPYFRKNTNKSKTHKPNYKLRCKPNIHCFGMDTSRKDAILVQADGINSFSFQSPSFDNFEFSYD